MAKSKIKISRFEKNDKKKAADFCRQIYLEMGWDPQFMYGFANFGQTFGREREIFLLAKDKEKIVGSVGLKELNQENALMKRFYIAKEYRGQGLAQKLFQTLFGFARKKGFKKIYLDTYLDNLRAQKFYHKCGFEKFSPPPDPKWPECLHPEIFIFMERKIKGN